MTGFRRGDRGPAVAEVKARLARLGLLPGSRYAQEHRQEDPLRSGPQAHVSDPSEWETTALVSAEFDEDVEQAVRTFQEQRGITVDGIVGPETFRRLEEARWRLGDRILSYAAAHPTVGEDVLDLQRRLNAMGFDCGREDGHLGPQTDKAIREFQRNTGIPADGVCGPATFRALGQLKRTVGKESSQTVRERYSMQQMRTGVRGKVVVIDPSSGVGAAAKDEATICSSIAGRIEGRLSALGTQVLMTRQLSGGGPSDNGEAAHAEFCNGVGADLVIALALEHDPEQPGGAATYYYGSDRGSISVPGQVAARMLLEGITERTDLASRADHPKTWDLLRMTRMPAVRVVIGNSADPTDRSRLSDPVFQDSLSRAVADAVVRFFSP